MINLAIVGLGKWGQELVKSVNFNSKIVRFTTCLLYTSPSPRDRTRSRMPSSA